MAKEESRYAQLLPHLEIAVQADPGNVILLEHMGLCLLKTRRYARAEQTFQKLADLPQTSPLVKALALRDLGMAREKIGDREGTASAFSKAINATDECGPDMMAHEAREAAQAGILRLKSPKLS